MQTTMLSGRTSAHAPRRARSSQAGSPAAGSATHSAWSTVSTRLSAWNHIRLAHRMATASQGGITLHAVAEQPPPRSDRRLLLRAALCAVLVTLMTAGTTVAAVLLQVRDVVTIVKQGQPAIPRIRSALDDVAAGKPQTILLLGSDHRFAYDALGNKQANSDTMILVHLDPD